MKVDLRGIVFRVVCLLCSRSSRGRHVAGGSERGWADHHGVRRLQPGEPVGLRRGLLRLDRAPQSDRRDAGPGAAGSSRTIRAILRNGSCPRWSLHRAAISSFSPRARTGGTPRAQLHTSFSLQADGESVAIVKPDGQTVAFEYRDYPPQLVDISYGLGGGGVVSQTETVLIREGSGCQGPDPDRRDARPHLDAGRRSTTPSWPAGTTGVGYDYVPVHRAGRGHDAGPQPDGLHPDPLHGGRDDERRQALPENAV